MKKNWLILIVILLLHIIVLNLLQFNAWPEMVSFPYLINHGFITYKDMVHAYPPLLVNVLGVSYRIFGYKLIVLKIFGWGTILTSDLLIFLTLKKLARKESLVILGTLVYIFLQPILEGNMIWPDLFIIPFLLLTFLFLLNRNLFWSGVAIGLAILTKQTGIFFLGIGLIWITVFEKNIKKVFNFIAGTSFIILPFSIILIAQKSFIDFVNWTLIYPSQYWTKFPGYVHLSPTLRENLILLTLFLPLGILVFKIKKNIFIEKYFLLLFGFLICGIAGVYPRFSFFHFQSALTFLVILIFFLISKYRNIKYQFLILMVPLFIFVINFRSLNWKNARFWTQSDINLAQTIQSLSPNNKPIYLLGLNSNLYAFADRLPNKPWLDNFGWYLEIPGVQENLIKSFEENKPSTIFWVKPEVGNWYDIGTYQPKIIIYWIKKNYIMKKEIQKGIWEWIKK